MCVCVYLYEHICIQIKVCKMHGYIPPHSIPHNPMQYRTFQIPFHLSFPRSRQCRVLSLFLSATLLLKPDVGGAEGSGGGIPEILSL